jgi:integral membrane sensor domain MASE1
MRGDLNIGKSAVPFAARFRSSFAIAFRWLLFCLLLIISASIREGPSSVIDQAIIWLPTGVAIAGLWLLGRRAWWVVAAATFLQRWRIGYDWGVCACAAAGSTLEALIGVMILRRLGFRHSLLRLRDLGAVLATAAIAPLGSIAVSWAGRLYIWSYPGMPFYSGWDGWWRMNALGVITIVPAALSWLGRSRQHWPPRLLAEFGAGLLVLLIVLMPLFLLLPGGAMGIMWMNLTLMGIALFAGVRYGVLGATLATLLLTLAVAVRRNYWEPSFCS